MMLVYGVQLELNPLAPIVTALQLMTLVAWILESAFLRPLAWATTAVSCYALWDYAQAAKKVRA